MCRQVTRRVWRSVDVSLDECRQMYTSVDEPKIFTLIPEKETHGPIFLLLQFCNSRPHRYANFQFYSFICCYCSSQCSHSSLTPHISKTNFPIELMLERPLKENGSPPCMGDGSLTPPTKL